MKIWGLQLQHLMDTLSVNFVGCRTNFFWGAIGPSKTRVDELLTILVQQLKRLQMRACGYLDQLSKSISDLGHRQGAQKSEIEEGMYRCMIRPQTILVIAIVDRNFNGNRGIYQTNDCRRDTDEIRVPTIRRACKPTLWAV